ncbi:hypothetical protein TrVFT333_001759 [Trichoderma virens FT-333]|nr:hypothetical protein TrVFT333_001759 [Trichoderma virens FT-333]
MQFFAVAALFAASALAAPQGNEGCPGGVLHNVPMCCATNVLGVATLDCGTRKSPSSIYLLETPTLSISLSKYIAATVPVSTAAQFQAHCAGKGKQPVCCSLPVAGLGLLCEKPVGTQ